MGWFSVPEDPAEITARQQAEAERQLAVAAVHQEQAEKTILEHRRQGEISAMLQEMSRQNLEKQAMLLDHWEEQLKRFDAILTKWEQQK